MNNRDLLDTIRHALATHGPFSSLPHEDFEPHVNDLAAGARLRLPAKPDGPIDLVFALVPFKQKRSTDPDYMADFVVRVTAEAKSQLGERGL